MDSKWLVGGLCAAAGFAALVYYLADDGTGAKTTPTVRLNRDQLIRVLNELRKETSSAFVTIAGCAMSVKEQTQNRIDDESLKAVLVAQPTIKDLMKHAEAKVFERFGVSEEQVRHAYLKDFKDDPYSPHSEVRRLSSDLQKGLDDAYRGLAPKAGQSLPKFLTPRKVVEVINELYHISAREMLRQIEELRAQGTQISTNDARFYQLAESVGTCVEEAK